MKIAEQIISKGEYTHNRIEHFVNVKQYIFLRKNGKKCLILRFSNDADFIIDGMDIKIIQLDVAGNKITDSTLSARGLYAAPGDIFSLTDGIEVEEGCVDFRLAFSKVNSSDYSYFPRNGEIVAVYQGVVSQSERELKKLKKSQSSLLAFSKTEKKHRFSFVIALIMALLLSAAATLSYYVHFIFK